MLNLSEEELENHITERCRNMGDMFKMYGFFDDGGMLIEQIPSTDIEEAKKYFKDQHPDKKYMYIEVLF